VDIDIYHNNSPENQDICSR